VSVAEWSPPAILTVCERLRKRRGDAATELVVQYLELRIADLVREFERSSGKGAPVELRARIAELRRLEEVIQR